MSEAEAFELVLMMASELSQLMFGYFSIVSAFLIVSYFAADRLSALQSTIVLILYTICSIYVILNVYALNTDLDSLYAEMLLKKETGIYELAWFGKNPIWIPTSLTITQIAICLGGYLGSVVFFLSKGKPNIGRLFGGAT